MNSTVTINFLHVYGAWVENWNQALESLIISLDGYHEKFEMTRSAYANGKPESVKVTVPLEKQIKFVVIVFQWYMGQDEKLRQFMKGNGYGDQRTWRDHYLFNYQTRSDGLDVSLVDLLVSLLPPKAATLATSKDSDATFTVKCESPPRELETARWKAAGFEAMVRKLAANPLDTVSRAHNTVIATLRGVTKDDVAVRLLHCFITSEQYPVLDLIYESNFDTVQFGDKNQTVRNFVYETVYPSPPVSTVTWPRRQVQKCFVQMSYTYTVDSLDSMTTDDVEIANYRVKTIYDNVFWFLDEVYNIIIRNTLGLNVSTYQYATMTGPGYRYPVEYDHLAPKAGVGESDKFICTLTLPPHASVNEIVLNDAVRRVLTSWRTTADYAASVQHKQMVANSILSQKAFKITEGDKVSHAITMPTGRCHV